MQWQVAYGLPRRSVDTRALFAALRNITVNFDESPARMVCVVRSTPEVRWLGFACSEFERGRVLAEGHFTESLAGLVGELFVVARSRYSPSGDHDRVEWVRHHGNELIVRGDGVAHVVLERGALPRRDGTVLEIASDAAGLRLGDPFEALGRATHQVVLRSERRAPARLKIARIDARIPPVGVEPEASPRSTGERFERTLRRMAAADAQAHAALLERVTAAAERQWVAHFEYALHRHARSLADAGEPIAPLLIARLAEPKPRPRPTRVYLAALGMLGGERAARAVLPWTARGSADLAQSAMHALISMGASARAALEGAAASKSKAERAAAARALALLDSAAYAGLRAVREARDALSAEARQALLDAHGAGWLDPRSTELRAPRNALLVRHGAGAAAYLIGHVLETSDSQPADVSSVLRAMAGDPLGPWAAGLVLLERPLPTRARLGNAASREGVARDAREAFGARFDGVLDALLVGPPLDQVGRARLGEAREP